MGESFAVTPEKAPVEPFAEHSAVRQVQNSQNYPPFRSTDYGRSGDYGSGSPPQGRPDYRTYDDYQGGRTPNRPRNMYAERADISAEDAFVALCKPSNREEVDVCRDLAQEYVAKVKQSPLVSTDSNIGKIRGLKAVQDILDNFELLDSNRDNAISPYEAVKAAQSKNETVRTAGETLIANENLDWDFAAYDYGYLNSRIYRPFANEMKPGITRKDLEMLTTAINGDRKSFNALAKRTDIQSAYDKESRNSPPASYGYDPVVEMGNNIVKLIDLVEWPYKWTKIQLQNRDEQWQRLSNRVKEIKLPGGTTI